jgi:hypothetical protein
MGHLLAPLYTSLERFTSLRLSGSSRQNVLVETLERFPDGIDGSWGDRENFAFFTRRNTAYLNWRFVQNPHSYLLFGASCSGCLVGYIVVRIFKQNLYRVAVLADFAVKDDRADIFVPLLITVEKRMKAIGIDKMELWASETLPYYSPLRKLKYRPAGSVNVIVFTQTAAASELLAIDKPWHFTIADSDNV